MTTYSHSLNTIELSPETPIYNPTRELNNISLTDPAIYAMTDLKNITAITIDGNSTIDLALEIMRHAGVRLLLVVDNEKLITGIITARDIMSEKPLKVIEQEHIKHDEILVHHAMTKREELNFLDFRDVEHSSVQDIILKLKDEGRQHGFVIELNEVQDNYFARGIFSITQIGKQLGMEISLDGHVQSFSEFEKLFA